MTERIQKIISAAGLASRRQAETWITQGRVTCNGQVCKLGDTADASADQICVDGKPLPVNSRQVYILLHKPRGFVTTLSDEKGRKNVAQLVEDCGLRVYPVGRLDMDSEGLLLLTNDGDFANKLMHPSREVEKEYHVKVKGCTPEAVERLKQPILLDGYQIKKPEVSVLQQPAGRDSSALVSVTIHEGRNRQVRRMCAAAGMEVIRLKRVREGSLLLGNLPCGKWRYLTEDEKTRVLK